MEQMTCEHCGSNISPDGTSCPQCGFEIPKPSASKKSAKVVPFRPRKKARRPVPSKKRPPTPTFFWWFIAILAAAIVLPYIVPMHP
ncbi:MAG: hypothetical protein OWR62_08140 [Sulfobacillus thermotolerans]|nr:hypothetical protein [Sulfobacillus thermotolerans]